MKAKPISKILATALALIMLFSVIPVSTIAATVDYEAEADDYYKVISKKDWDLAPGIVESEIVLNNAAGSHRQVAHVVEVDINNEYTKVIPSYKGMIPTPGNYGVQIMAEQAAFAEENGYGNVVAAMNISLSWYDSAYYDANPHLVGEPLGYMILDGVQYTNSQGQTVGAQTCAVINFDEKDGVARPADIPKVEIRSTSSAITGWEEQVIPANFGFLVKDGVNQYAVNHGTGASRSFIGIKADGTFVMVMNDGRQAPFSAGFTEYEMGEFMLSLGCVAAINGDGGGSSQFLSQRPGEDLELHCSPSDGAERETTHGILVISTAPATGEFVRATIEAPDQYYTPGSSVQFTAVGSDLVGTPADIPADAVWQLADPTMGTIENGLFVSNGKVGTATAQIVYGGKVVGEASVDIVIPEKIEFSQSAIVVPFGKTAQLSVKATINEGIHEVVIKEGDITLSLDNDAIGVLDGAKFTFTAVVEEDAPENLKGTLTATMNHGDGLVITVPFSVGKGSDIIYDFEDKDLTGWSIYTNYGKYGPVGPNGSVTDANGNYWYHGQNERGYLSIVDSSTGKVRNGKCSLAVECDFSQLYETGYHALNLFFPLIDCTDSLQIGFWLYVPYDARHVQMKIGSTDYDNGRFFEFNEGWHYIKGVAANNQFYYVNISIDDRAPNPSYNYYDYITEANISGKYTFYIDDITVDYSTAVEDRENPVFGDVSLVGNDSSQALSGTTVITDNTPTFEVSVADDATLGNSVGLNADSAAAYIDGKKVACTFRNGKLSVSGIQLSDGVHDIRFEIADNAGNASWAGGKVKVATGTDTSSTVKVVPQNPDLVRPLIGSLYWMDVVATNIETIDKVEMTFDLNNASQWELEGIETAEGFEASYTIQEDDNLAFITITRVGENTQVGEAVLASFPVRTWESTITQYEGYENQTPATLVSRGIIWKKAIELALQRGVITYVENYETTTLGTFGMEDLLVETEVFFTNYTRAYVTGAQAWINEKKAAKVGWHEHTATTIEKAATCTENGYTGRTYCEVCDSVVDWGTTVAATGHDWALNTEGKLACVNGGELYNGKYTDGKEYIDGVVVADGWNEDKTAYYVDGVKLIGSKFIDGVMYTFDENGNYLPDYKYNGFYEINDTVMYFENNEYKTGCQWIETIFYNFDKNGMGYDGEIELCGTKCLFEDGQFVATEGILLAGTCGDDVYYVIYADGTLKLDGTGSTMDFLSLGMNPWWRQEYRMNVKKIVIGKGITRIGERAFVNTYATEVVFEEGSQLTTIAKNAFAVMEKLTTITLPDGLKSLGHRSIYHCSNLTDVYLPSSLTTIASDTFEASPKAVLHVVKGSDALIKRIEELGLKYEIYVNEEVYSGTCGENASWTLSGGVLKISGSGAMTDFAAGGAPWYKYKDMIFAVEIGKDITSVGSFSFYSCGNLESVTFAEGGNVANIGKGAFGYSGIKEITVPATVKTMGTHVFYNCAKLETVAFGDGNEIVVLDKYTFWNCVSLKNVYIPDGVASIGSNAFLNIGDVTLSVVTDSFAHKYAVKNGIDFVTRAAKPFVKYEGSCGENAKWELYSDGLLKISGSGAMADYAAGGTPWNKYRSEVTAIVIGKDITSIGSFSFYYCQNAATVTFEEGCAPTSIGKGAFGYTGIIEITVPSSVKTMGTHVFYNSTKLETVSFGDANPLSTIDKYTFWNCVSLKNVYIPDGVTAIGTNAFLNTGEVSVSVVIDSFAHTYAVKNGIAFTTRAPKPFVQYEGSCGENAKWELYSDGLLKISGSGAMTDYAAGGTPWNAYRQDVTAIVIGKDITHVGSFSFYYCQNAKTVTFEEGSALEMIGRGGFGYTGIEEVVIPASVKTLDRYAFYFSKELAVVTFAEGSQLVKMDAYAFRGTTSLSEVNGVPANATIHRNAYLESAYVAE